MSICFSQRKSDVCRMSRQIRPDRGPLAFPRPAREQPGSNDRKNALENVSVFDLSNGRHHEEPVASQARADIVTADGLWKSRLAVCRPRPALPDGTAHSHARVVTPARTP